MENLGKFFSAALVALVSLCSHAVEYTIIPYSTAMTATGSSYYDANRTYVYAIDGSGLTETASGSGVYKHTTSYSKAMWMTKSGAPSTTSPKFYCVDLGASYNLGRIKIWNYNQDGCQTRGFKATEIYLSDEADPARTTPAEIRAWGDAVWTGELSKATGSSDTGCSPISFHGQSARYVGIVTTSSWGDNYAGLSEVRFYTVPEGVPDFSSTAVEVNSSDDGFVARATTESDAQSAQVTALAYADSSSAPTSIAFDATVAPGVEATKALTGLASDTTYSILMEAANSVATVTNDESVIIYTGTPILAFLEDGLEKGCVPAKVTVSRVSADPFPLTINYSLSSSDGEEGVDYETPSGTVTIPANATSATIEVVPMVNPDKSSDVHVTVSLEPGKYHATGATDVQVAIANAVIPADANVWVAGSASDGLASTASNWSKGIPRADNAESLVILVDGNYSLHDMVWDADGTTDLATTITSWTQTGNYIGTVEFNTEFPTYSSATFPLFTITGDCQLDSGVWTHRGNYANYGAATESSTEKLESKRWCLNVLVGGNFAIASGASIDVSGKGFGHPGNQNAPSYGGWGYTNTTTKASCAPYGSITEPFDPGMGARSQSDKNTARSGIGGGVVKLVVAGKVTVDGSIKAFGNVDLNIARSGGTGGSIWIDASQISGSGLIDASACQPSYFTSDQVVAIGSGGRIALYTKSTLAIARSNLVCNGSTYNGTSGTSKTKIGSCGTIFIKDSSMPNGVLFLKQQSSVATALSVNTEVPLVADITLDGIVMDGCVALTVDSGKSLTLPGGLASITSSATAIGVNGMIYRGGAINFGSGDQTISNWMFEPAVSFAFPANLTLSDYGAVGILRRNICDANEAAIPSRSISFSVAGNLTIDATSAVDVSQVSGYTHYEASAKGGWHGGWTTYYDKNSNTSDARTKTYGSVFNPTDFGSSPHRGMLAGGALEMTISGKLAFDGGTITASGPVSDSAADNIAPPSGGSIRLTAGSISGIGSIVANGGAGKYNYAGGGAGGRIAVKLTTAGAALPNSVSVNAQGRCYGNTFSSKGTKLGSAGSVYVETAADATKCGTITISNWQDHPISDLTSATVIPTTPVVAYNNGDAVADFKGAKLVVTNNAIAEVSADELTMQSLAIATNSSLDLYGHTMTVSQATLGDTKLAAGTYTASDAAVSDYVTDTVGGGSLIVKSVGLLMFIR